MNKDNAINNAEIKLNSIDWYVPHFIPSLSQENIILNQIVKKMPTEFEYVERSVFMKEINTQNLCTFEIGTQEGINVAIWIMIGFQQSDRQHDQTLNNDTFYRHPVTSAQCIISNEKYPDSAILLNYNDDDYSQGYAQIKEAFKALTKNDLLQPYRSDNDFRSSNNGDLIWYNSYVFDIRYQKNFASAQTIKVEFKFDGVVPVGLYA